MELPSHPDADDGSPREPATGTSTAAKIVIGVLVALFVVVIVLHLTGVIGPGSH